MIRTSHLLRGLKCQIKALVGRSSHNGHIRLQSFIQ